MEARIGRGDVLVVLCPSCCTDLVVLWRPTEARCGRRGGRLTTEGGLETGVRVQLSF